MKKLLTAVPLALLLTVCIGCGSDSTELLEIQETTEITTEITTEPTTVATTTATTATTTESTTIPELEPATEVIYNDDSAVVDYGYNETVYIGNTGTKYHKESCRTLKGNGTAISLDDAIAQGRTACKVCNP